MIQQAAHLAMSDDARVERKRSRAVLPCTPADEAALSLVRAAMDGLAAAIEKLRESDARDVEGVHQARVSTRRAEAALLAFRGVIDEVSETRIRRRLREVRRCAGEIRQCDVQSELLEQLLDSAGADERVVIEALMKRLAKRRRASVEAFEPLLTNRELRRLEKAATRTALSAEWKSGATLTEIAERALPARAADMDVLCRTPDPSPEELHDLRIAGKRARYVLEVVGLCVPPEQFALAYRRMEQFQELLGGYNDDHELGQFLERAALKRWKLARKTGLDVDRVDAAVESLRRQVVARGVQRRALFLEWWGSEGARQMINILMGRGIEPQATMLIEPVLGRHIAC